MTPRIDTDRLTLRPPEIADARPLFELIKNVDVAKWLTAVPWPYSMQDAEDFLGHALAQNTSVYYIICFEGTLAGCISYGPQLGYWLGEPYWGQGFMSEAAEAVVADYFSNDHLELTSGYILGNEGSRRVLEKLGFARTELVDVTTRGFGDVQVQRMKLVREDWTARQ